MNAITPASPAAAPSNGTAPSTGLVEIVAEYAEAQPGEFGAEFTSPLLEEFLDTIRQILDDTLTARPASAQSCNVVAMRLVDPQWSKLVNGAVTVRIGSSNTTSEQRRSFMEQLREALVPRGITLVVPQWDMSDEQKANEVDYSAAAC